jgi:hypothetical protein
MRKAIILSTIIYVLLSPALALATDFGGNINTDTTWNLVGSPFKFLVLVKYE